jgi:hypothetical protein
MDRRNDFFIAVGRIIDECAAGNRVDIERALEDVDCKLPAFWIEWRPTLRQNLS